MARHYRIIAKIVYKEKIKRMVEVGVYRSKFLRNVLGNEYSYGMLDEYWAVDPWKEVSPSVPKIGKTTQCEWDELHKYCCTLMLDLPKLRVLRMDSVGAASIFPDGYFDLVYIDASHEYEDVRADILAWYPKVRNGGLIGGHDYEGMRRVLFGVSEAVDELFLDVETRLDGIWLKRVTGDMVVEEKKPLFLEKHWQVMTPVILKHKTKKMIEIGVWKGHFTKRILGNPKVAKTMKEYWAVDTWEVLDPIHGRLSRVDQEKWDDVYRYCCNLMMYFPQLKIMKMKSLEAIKIFPKGYFDLVYVDASHQYEDVLEDIKAWLPKVRKGGLMTGHDYNHPTRGDLAGVTRAVDEIFGKGKVQTGDDTVWYIEV